MTIRSQNGWLAQRGELDNRPVEGTAVNLAPGVRAGDVATVLHYLAGRFHREVEPLIFGWSWGYAPRPIRGSSTSVSNHASGTAIDLNAPNHPLGRSGTFTPAQVTALRRILAACEGVVRWGGDYSGRKDEMHFEVNATPEAVARVARKITDPPKPIGPVSPEDEMTDDDRRTAADRHTQLANELTAQRNTMQNVERAVNEIAPTLKAIEALLVRLVEQPKVEG